MLKGEAPGDDARDGDTVDGSSESVQAGGEPEVDHVAAPLVDLVRRMPHLVGVADDAGRLVWVNDAGLRFLGADGTTPLTTADLFAPQVFDQYYASIRPALARDGVWTGELPVRRTDGRTGVVDAVLVGDVEPSGEVRWLACLAVDVSEQHEREERLSHQASHDPLTGLPNRALLHDRLTIALSVAARVQSPVAVIALDLDGFKEVNDALGHAAGDELLQQVTARIRLAVRDADTVARLGGDEFVVVVHPPEEPTAAIAVAERIREQIGLVDYALGDRRVRITASIGLTIAEPGTSPTPDVLLAAADRGMYRAKRSGGNRVRLASSNEPGVVDHLDQVGAELASSLAEGRFVAAFEPVFDLSDGSLCAVQSRARWEHPVQGRLPARDFAEEAAVTGYADLVWWAATRRALRSAAEAGFDLPVHVSLSTSQLRDQDLVGRLRAIRGLAPEIEVHLRVDAHSLLELATMGGELMDTLLEEGLQLVLAGHGEHNLPSAILAALPLSALELDSALVASLPGRAKAIELAAQVAGALDVPCIAQVEREQDLPLLRALGVTSARGRVMAPEWDAGALAAVAAERRAATPPRP
ncbi:MAG TPA: diguanylate cyclase [Acidimicrobiales bacterium]|nr:diguanylate cyclase [Acidimicrobiales bacterium]